MTTEDLFRKWLDADRTDQRIRKQYAEWLKREGDDRADGMMWLALMGKYPDTHANSWYSYSFAKKFSLVVAGCSYLPDDLFREATGAYEVQPYHDQKQAENVVCCAFARLPAARQAELMREARFVAVAMAEGGCAITAGYVPKPQENSHDTAH
jgi:hypothetical protein